MQREEVAELWKLWTKYASSRYLMCDRNMRHGDCDCSGCVGHKRFHELMKDLMIDWAAMENEPR